MIFALFLPLLAGCYIVMAAFLKKRTLSWQIGAVAVGLAFFNIVSMAFNSFFQGKVYNAVLMPFLKIGEIGYEWCIRLETAEIFLVVFIVFSALMSLLFVKDLLVQVKMNRYVVFLLGLVSCLIVAIGARNVFQFFAGWDFSVIFAYLLLMLFHEKQAVRRSGINFLVWHLLTDIPLFFAFYLLSQKTGSFFISSFPTETFEVFKENQRVIFALLVLLGVSAKLFLFGTNILISQTAGIFIAALSFIAPAALGGLGIYILYTLFPFMNDSPAVHMIFIVWGALTTLAGLLMAAVQTNIKVLLCQLLMSQFGFVLIVFGILGRDEAFAAYISLIIPMTGLMLCSGTISEALQGEEDISRMGKLRRHLPFSFWSMLLFCLCCIGFPQIGNCGVVLNLFSEFESRAALMAKVCLTGYLFALALVFSRLLFRVFYAETKISPITLAKIRHPSTMESIPLSILLILSFFQNEVFKYSILPEFSNEMSKDVLLSLVVAMSGLPLGVMFFFKKERVTDKKMFQTSGRLERFCRNGFYLTDFYRTVFVRPCMVLAEWAWHFSDTALLTERLPKAIKGTAERLQETHSGKPSDFLIWSLGGLFVLIFIIILLPTGR